MKCDGDSSEFLTLTVATFKFASIAHAPRKYAVVAYSTTIEGSVAKDK